MSTLTDDTLSLLQQAATEARGLAIDAIDACSSGPGLPLGCAEMGAALFGNHLLNYDPASPKWLNRDRFILSGAWLHVYLFLVTSCGLRALFGASEAVSPIGFGNAGGILSSATPSVWRRRQVL